MSKNRPRASHLVVRAFLISSAFALTGLFTRPLAAQAPLKITQAGFAGGKLAMNWTSNALAYEVQTTDSLLAPNWRPVLHTVRTNVLLPLEAGSGFFRVVGPKPNGFSLVMTMTNLASGDAFTLTLQPQTNADLVFNNLTDTNAAVPVQVVVPAAELEKFDIRFDPAGGFTIVNPNGDPAGSGGLMTWVAGPGTNQLTYGGFLTNGTDMVMFSSASTPLASRPGMVSAQDNGTDSTAGAAGDTGNAAFSAIWCAPAWAAQGLACVAAGVNRNLGCIGFPPRARGGYGFISSRTGVTLDIVTGKLTGQCDSHCRTCCKDLFTGALSDCTQ